ncbi:ComEC/Rec2 family competence protein [uncultured Bartonella sp.]|uniref:ComEC/Rec2 family competence protein n=1 Tax=uncultured Bartonella sp. TaxID=104108 RepID=UPI00260CCF12|nr:ComEC/Rec2 family competence protein [uncultured Bartonella sp.]
MRPAAQLYSPLDRHVVSLPNDIPFIVPYKTGFKGLYQKLADILKRLRGSLVFELDQGLGFLLLPVFMTIGVVVYFHLSYEPDGLRLAAYFVLTSGLLFLSRHYRPLFFLISIITCISHGALSAKIETWRVATPMLGRDVSTTLNGRIARVEKTANGKSRLVVDILSTKNPELKYSPQRVKLSGFTKNIELNPGDGIEGRVRLRAASGPVRPNSYDFSFYNYFQSIGAQGYFVGKPTKTIVKPPSSLFDRLSLDVSRLRQSMTNRITEAIGGETGSIAAALITGERSGISPQTNEALRIAGLSHILSISGLHMAMVAGMVLIVMRTIFAFFQSFSSRFQSKKIAACGALFISAFYLLLSGSDVAAERSFVMVAVMLIAIIFDRSAITMRNLAIAALITLIVVPHEVLGPSFQMSFSATAALVAIFGWWSRNHRANRNTTPMFVGGKIFDLMLFPVVSTAVASLVAGLASGIFASYHFSNTAPLGVISNALAFPVMSIAVMPFALLAALLMPFGLEWWPLQIMGAGVKIVEQIAYSVAAISPDINPGTMPPIALIILSCGLIVLLFFKTRLCLFSGVFFAVGIAFIVFQKQPLLLVSEDRGSVGLIDRKILYVTDLKPTKFTANIWQRSYGLDEIVGPAAKGQQIGAQFWCEEGICHALLSTGLKVAVIEKQNSSELICPDADIVVVSLNIHMTNCHPEQKVITPNLLGLKGSILITSNEKIISSVNSGPTRPWNEYRKYLR